MGWLIVSRVAFACSLDPAQFGDVMVREKGPADEQYQVFYVGTPFEGGDGRLFHSPKFVVLSQQDCQVRHIFELPEGKTGVFVHDMMINPKGGNILLSSLWSEWKYDDQGQMVARGKMSQISLYDYKTFSLILHRRFDKSVHQPESHHLLSADGEYLYFTVSSAISDPVYKMRIDDLLLVDEMMLDQAYVDKVGLDGYKSKSFTTTAYADYKSQNTWHDFEDQSLLRVWAKDDENKPKGIFYSLEGVPVVTLWWEGSAPKSASPSAWESRYNVKIAPLPSRSIAPDDPRQGVILKNSIETLEGKTLIKDNVDLEEGEYLKRRMISGTDQGSEIEKNHQQPSSSELSLIKSSPNHLPVSEPEIAKQKLASMPEDRANPIFIIVLGLAAGLLAVYLLIRRRRR